MYSRHAIGKLQQTTGSKLGTADYIGNTGAVISRLGRHSRLGMYREDQANKRGWVAICKQQQTKYVGIDPVDGYIDRLSNKLW